MKHALLALIGAFAVAGTPAAQVDKDAAEQAARQWLTELDAGHYETCWHQAAESFRRQIAERPWRKIAEAVRAPLGEVQSRRLLSAKHQHNPPEAPPGNYVVLRFESTFTRNEPVVETVTPKRTDDGWKVSGYYLR